MGEAARMVLCDPDMVAYPREFSQSIVGCGDQRKPHRPALFTTDAVRYAHHILRKYVAEFRK